MLWGSPESDLSILKTVIAPVAASSKKTQANILFDEGAQRSFISAEQLVKDLELPQWR